MEPRELRVHPAADRFPMMSDEELADLAEDIKANGLAHPIIVDGDVLIDGRNRLAACKLAGVEPTFEDLGRRDPLALIASRNLKRRNLTKGQQAMGYAFLYPEPEKGGRGKKTERVDVLSTFSKKSIQRARAVLSFSPELAQEVLANITPLDEALQKVEAERQRALGDAARTDRLRKGAPDLAELVEEGRMSLREATVAWQERETERRNAYEAGVSSVKRLGDFLGHVSAIIGGEQARAEDEPPILVPPEQLKYAKTTLSLLEKFCGVMVTEDEAFYETGTAFLKIRDDQLYRKTHATFEEYCIDRWKMPRDQVKPLMEIAEIVCRARGE